MKLSDITKAISALEEAEAAVIARSSEEIVDLCLTEACEAIDAVRFGMAKYDGKMRRASDWYDPKYQ